MSNKEKKINRENTKRYLKMNWKSKIPEEFGKEVEYRRKEQKAHGDDEAYYERKVEKGYRRLMDDGATSDSPRESDSPSDVIPEMLIRMYGGVENLLEALTTPEENEERGHENSHKAYEHDNASKYYRKMASNFDSGFDNPEQKGDMKLKDRKISSEMDRKSRYHASRGEKWDKLAKLRFNRAKDLKS